MKSVIRYLTKNDQFTHPKPLKPTGIVVHSTGCNQRLVEPYLNGFNIPSVGKSVHGFIGMDNNVLTYVQTLPYNIRCAGCGSGTKGSYNASHIQFEICEDVGDSKWFTETYNAALDVCAELCTEYGIKPENVICHSEAYLLGYGSNHADVMHWWSHYGKSMDTFRKDLSERLDDMATRYKTINDVPAALRKETQELINSGALKGNENGLDVTEDMLRSMIIIKRYVDGR